MFFISETNNMATSMARDFARVKDGWSPQTRLKKNCLHETQKKRVAAG